MQVNIQSISLGDAGLFKGQLIVVGTVIAE
jgi:hypothetical protein